MPVPLRPEQILVLGGTVVEVWGDSLRTILPDGATVPAAPQDNDAYRATAARLGYGDDTLRMCLEHEAAHSAVCAWLGLTESPTLGRVARGQGSTAVTDAEEDMVLAIQRFCRASGIDLLARLRK